jgi:hypothetical protein
MSFYDNNDSSSKSKPPLGSGSSTTAAGTTQSGLAASSVGLDLTVDLSIVEMERFAISDQA